MWSCLVYLSPKTETNSLWKIPPSMLRILNNLKSSRLDASVEKGSSRQHILSFLHLVFDKIFTCFVLFHFLGPRWRSTSKENALWSLEQPKVSILEPALFF
jgi:hypothetical protein